MLNNLNSWYSLLECEYPKGYYRLNQHSLCYDEDAFLHRGITSTTISEGSYDGLLQVAKSHHLDVYDAGGLVF